MKELFYPTSVVVIGVSSSKNNLARGIVFNLMECRFKGVIYQVGKNPGIFAGRRIYTSVLDVPDELDMAIILTPAPTIPEILDECGKKGIRWAIIESGGFGEYGEEGRVLEEELLRVARKWGIRFVGPNCIGIINMENGLSTPFPPIGRMVRRGDISIITQSGGVGVSLLHLLANEGLGLNKFVSLGNMLDIQVEEYLQYLVEDPGTRFIFLYLEGIKDGRKLMEVAGGSHKPIIAFKANVGRSSKKIALSHSASLSSDDRIVDAALRQCGIVRVYDATTLGNDLKILRLPPMKGKNLAIMSRSGGHAVIAADACETSGLNLVQLPRDFLEQIEGHFRASVIRLTNPLDLGDLFDMEVYARIIDETLARPEVDGMVFLHTYHSVLEGQGSRELFSRVIRLSEAYDKPVALYVSTDDQEVSFLKRNLNYPVFTQVVETVRALELNRRYHERKERIRRHKSLALVSTGRLKDKAHLAVQKALEEGRDMLLYECFELLRVYGIPVCDFAMVYDEDQACKAASRIGFPVALKIVSPQVSHKTDLKGVELGIPDEGTLRQKLGDMRRVVEDSLSGVQISGFLIQSMVEGGREVILGGVRDAQFGPVVMAGLGGIFVEVIQDVTHRIAPICPEEAMEMLQDLKAYEVLRGVRGLRALDLAALSESISKLSLLMWDMPEVAQVDLNPVKVLEEGKGVLAVDARVILKND